MLRFWPFRKRQPPAPVAKAVVIKKKPGRPTKEESARRRAEKLKAELRGLALEAKVQELRERLERGRSGEPTVSDLEQTLRILERLRTLVPDPDKDTDAPGWLKLLLRSEAGRDLARALAVLVPAAVMQQGGAVPPTAVVSGMMQAPTLPVVPTAPEVAQLPEQSQDGGTPVPQPAGMSLISQWVVSQLEPLTPEQAARWLLSQPAPQAAQLVQLFVMTPDERLPALLAELGGQIPDLAGAMNWLRSRPQWFIETVHALRALSGTPRRQEQQGS